MVSYFKTQWWRLLVALFCLVMCCIYAFKPAPEVLTVEALDEVMSNMLTANLHFLGFIIWMLMSFINHLQDRIELLEKKQERDDTMYALVQELVTANKIDREIMKKYEERLKKLED
jgi:type VI protein secretion system component VasK